MSSSHAHHAPKGNPCTLCGRNARMHHVTHRYYGLYLKEPCRQCGLPQENHHPIDPETRRLRRARAPKYPKKKVPYKWREFRYYGIDGEGQTVTDEDGIKRHYYTLIAASNPEKFDPHVLKRKPGAKGLSTVECLDFLLTLPMHNTKIFAYSFNYDITKILQDVDEPTLFMFARPELRQRCGKKGDEKYKGPRGVWWNGYYLNNQGSKFTVAKGKRKIHIWDIFKFFGCRFTKALSDWGIGSPERIKFIAYMKDHRAEFDKMPAEEVERYCLEECAYIGELARKITIAHREAGIPLRKYHGAGSSGEAMLDSLETLSKIRLAPVEMKHAVASSFFGGRFENAKIGSVEGALEAWDISSAYPYNMCFLPCLEHGEWELTKDRTRFDDAKIGLVHYKFWTSPLMLHKRPAWGPFPFRTPDGSISFPYVSGGGWVWQNEFREGEKAFPHVRFREAWVYKTNCDCQPFQRIAEYYLLRLKLGKEGAGLSIKLGINSGYGKLAQSVGNAKYNCWIWAALITSGCRSQVLAMMNLHQDKRNMLMVATDSVLTREKLVPPTPRDTGTFGAKKPLGGWEQKKYPRGIFLARPGIYFPMNPTEADVAEVRARGVGKGTVLKYWREIVEAYKTHGITKTFEIAKVSRFCGIKTSISLGTKSLEFTRANATDGILPSYGNWVERIIDMSFNPMPKRECVEKDGTTLRVRLFPTSMESTPYPKALDKNKELLLSAEALEMLAAHLEASEQPDGDLTDYSEVG